MRIRSLVSSAAILTLLATSSLVSEALAQKGTVMAPSTSWAVSKVDNQAGPYCALARQFNKNTVLTIARNEQAETSFALDFQRPVFRPGAAVNLILDPGAGQQRAYETKPVSNKAFVVKLGRDSTFFKALDRTGLLRVEINDQSYHFNVADIDAGQFKLDACVASMVMPAAGEEGPLTPEMGMDIDKAVANASKSYRQEINSLRRQIKGLKEANNGLKGRLAVPEEVSAEVSGSVVELSGKLRTLEDENTTLKRQLELANATQTESVQSDDMSAEQSADVAALETENLRLKAELQTLNPQEDVIAGLESEIQTLKSQNAGLQSSVDAQNEGSDLVAELQTQIQGLEEQNAAMNSKVVEAKQDIESDYKAQIAALESKNASMKSTMDKKGVDAELLDQLRQQIAQAENENRLLNETAAQTQKNLGEQLQQENVAAVEDARAEQAEKIAKLELDLSTLKLENVRKGKELVELGAESSELQALQEENTSLQEQLALVEAQRGQAESMLGRIETLENENKILESRLADADVSDSEGGESLAALEQENEALKLAVQESAAKTGQAGALEAEVEALQGANEALQQQAVNDEVHEELKAALEANADLRSDISDKDLQLVELSALQQELSALKEKNTLAQSDAETQGEQQEEGFAALEKQRDELKSVLADVVAVAERFKGENGAQKLEIQSLKEERLALLEQSSQVSQVEPVSFESNDGDLEDSRRALDAMQSQMQQLESENKQLRDAAHQAPVTQPISAPASPQPLLENPKAAPLAAPTPHKKPLVVPAQPMMKDASAAPALPDVPKLTDDGGIHMALAEVEAQMRDTDKGDQVRMQKLAREYMVLKAQAEQAGFQIAKNEFVESVLAEELLTFEEPVEVASVQDEMVYPDVTGLNEAQKQERAVKIRSEAVQRELVNRKAAVEAEQVAELPQVEPQENIVLKQSADPFEDIKVENEVAAVQTAAGSIERDEPAVRLVAPVAQQAAGIQNAALSAGAFSVADLITQAKVSTPDKIKKVDKKSDDFTQAYQWNGGSIYGSAEQKPLSSPGDFDRLVQDYLERTQARCPGEFAIVPDNTIDSGSVRADSYEVACVGAQVSSGASLLFFNQGGTFTVVAHEAPTEELGTAMTYRNKLMRLVTGS